MNHWKRFVLFTLITTLLSTLIAVLPVNAKASDSDALFEPSLHEFIASVSAHPDSGQAALTEKIEQLDLTQGQFSPELYGYLEQLSYIKQANQQHVEAIELHQRMQTLTHWMDGVDSPLQLASIRHQSRSLVALGKVVRADKLEQFHLWVAEKNFQNEDLVPSIWRLADWQRATLQYRKSVKNYDRALTMVANQNLDPALATRTLEAKALAEHLAKIGKPEVTLELALNNRMTGDFSDQLATQSAKLNLADLYTLYKDNAAHALYADLQNVPAAYLGPRSRQDYLMAFRTAENPLLANVHTITRYPEKTETIKFGESAEPKAPTTSSIGEPVRLCAADVPAIGYVDVSLQISALGKPTNLHIEGRVPARVKRYLRAVLMESRYRPEIIDGKAVTQLLEFRQHFDKSQPMTAQYVSGWSDILAEHACQTLAMR